MYFNFFVTVPEVPGKIVRVRKGKETVYIYYEYDRMYDAVRKFNIPKRAVIGKETADDPSLMYPNRNYFTHFPDAELPLRTTRDDRSGCLRIGTFLVIRTIAESCGLNTMMERLFGSEGRLVLDLAAYSLICENNFSQYYRDYTFNHPLFTENMRIYSDADVSSVVSSITDNLISSFLNGWNYRRNRRGGICISFRSADRNCRVGDISLVESSHAGEHTGLPDFSFAVAYDGKSGEPLFYAELPGSSIDVPQLQYTAAIAEEYAYRKVCFILDRGYCTRDGIRHMDESGSDFLILANGATPLAASLVMEHRGTFESAQDCSIRSHRVYGKTVRAKLDASDTKERYFHICCSSARTAVEREELETRIERMAALISAHEGRQAAFPGPFFDYFQLNFDEKQHLLLSGTERAAVIERELKLCGYFVIITSAKMSAKEALDLYTSRDQNETLFRGDRSFFDTGDGGVELYESVTGNIFIEFIALIIRSSMYRRLREGMEGGSAKADCLTVPAAVKELENIELIRQLDGSYRLDQAVTEQQKSLLSAFGLDVHAVRTIAGELSTVLERTGSPAAGGKP